MDQSPVRGKKHALLVLTFMLLVFVLAGHSAHSASSKTIEANVVVANPPAANLTVNPINVITYGNSNTIVANASVTGGSGYLSYAWTVNGVPAGHVDNGRYSTNTLAPYIAAGNYVYGVNIVDDGYIPPYTVNSVTNTLIVDKALPPLMMEILFANGTKYVGIDGESLNFTATVTNNTFPFINYSIMTIGNQLIGTWTEYKQVIINGLNFSRFGWVPILIQNITTSKDDYNFNFGPTGFYRMNFTTLGNNNYTSADPTFTVAFTIALTNNPPGSPPSPPPSGGGGGGAGSIVKPASEQNTPTTCILYNMSKGSEQVCVIYNTTFIVGEDEVYTNLSATTINGNGWLLQPGKAYIIRNTANLTFYVKVLNITYFNLNVGAPTANLELYATRSVLSTTTTTATTTSVSTSSTTTTPTIIVITTSSTTSIPVSPSPGLSNVLLIIIAVEAIIIFVVLLLIILVLMKERKRQEPEPKAVAGKRRRRRVRQPVGIVSTENLREIERDVTSAFEGGKAPRTRKKSATKSKKTAPKKARSAVGKKTKAPARPKAKQPSRLKSINDELK